MKQQLLEAFVEIPSGVSVNLSADGSYTVKGPKAELSRRLFHPKIASKIEGNEIVLSSKQATMREKKMIFTFESHLRNMMKGVTGGFEYKLKVCSGHFPMNVAVKGEIFEVKNFIGEAVPRTLKIVKSVSIKVEGAEVTVTGNDLEKTSQMAASIEQLCRRNGFDRRIFQDGIYITHKDGDAI